MADKQTDTKVECNVDWERLQKELGNEVCMIAWFILFNYHSVLLCGFFGAI